MRERWGSAAGAGLVLVALLVGPALPGSAAAKGGDRGLAVATVSGPITGGRHGFPFTSSALDLAAHGYTEREYIAAGTAHAYEAAGAWGEDGRWGVEPTTSAPYRTRILVRAPSDPKDFSGTVVVEWLNVSSQVDIDVDFGFEGDEILRSGDAWVGVSAQAAGVNSTGGAGGLSLGPNGVGLKAWDPERYGSLEHAGDAYSYDIFSQVGRALKARSSANPLHRLDVEHLIADGESQSAFRMLTYVNAIQPVAHAYDGFLIHSRNGGGAPLGDGFDGPVPTARVRTDLDVPVFQFLTETDMYSIGASFPPARQPDTNRIRTWEVAGTAHADKHLLGQIADLIDCGVPINDGPLHLVAKAALRGLDEWVRNGTRPPTAPRTSCAAT
jgi:hypothetical protein